MNGAAKQRLLVTRAAAEELLAGEGWEGNMQSKCMLSCCRERDVHYDGIISGR